MTEELDDFLSEPEPTETVSETPEQEPVAAEAGDDQVTEESQEATGGKETETSPVPEKEPDSATVPITALHGERERRQAAERELEAYRQQQAQMREPDPYEDPDGYQAFRQHQAQSMQLQQGQQQLNSILLNERINITEVIARRDHEDYDQVKDVFADAALNNPALIVGLREAPDPAGYAYREGQKIMAQQEIGDDPAAYREKVKAEILAELRMEKTEAEKAEENLRFSIPNHLAEQRSVSDRKGPEWTGPDALGEILPGLG